MPVLLIGSLSTDQHAHLTTHLRSIGFEHVANMSTDFFDVQQARDLTHQLTQKSDNTTCIVYTLTHTNREAQNTLLKTLEEYGSNVPILLNIPSPDVFLPTIHSRCHGIDLRSIQNTNTYSAEGFDWIAWLDLKPNTRMKRLADIKDDMTLGMLREGVDILERYFHNQLMEKKEGKEDLETLQQVRAWLAGPNPSLNMVGEYMSLVLK